MWRFNLYIIYTRVSVVQTEGVEMCTKHMKHNNFINIHDKDRLDR